MYVVQVCNMYVCGTGMSYVHMLNRDVVCMYVVQVRM